MADGVVAMTYAKRFNVESAVDKHFSVYESSDVGFSLGKSYEELVNCLLSSAHVRNRQLIKRKYCLRLRLCQLNHTLGDGHTYYKLYKMLSAESEVDELNPVRVSDFEEAKTKIIGEEETAMFKSAGLALGIVYQK